MLELIQKNRSYRRFHQDVPVAKETLAGLVNLARLSASAGNKQPLKYVLSCTEKTNRAIFSALTWAAYLKDWPGPEEGERPSAYIVVLQDTRIKSPLGNIDVGIACQSILLGAVNVGLGGCILASINRNKLQQELRLPDHLEIKVVIALGRPKETVVIETARDGNIEYWRDEKGVHHVPKRPLEEIIWEL